MELIQELIDFGADINAGAYHDMAPLHIAVWHGRQDVIQLLIEEGVELCINFALLALNFLWLFSIFFSELFVCLGYVLHPISMPLRYKLYETSVPDQ